MTSTTVTAEKWASAKVPATARSDKDFVTEGGSMENKESSLRLSSSNASCNKRSFADDLNHSTEDIEFFHKE